MTLGNNVKKDTCKQTMMIAQWCCKGGGTALLQTDDYYQCVYPIWQKSETNAWWVANLSGAPDNAFLSNQLGNTDSVLSFHTFSLSFFLFFYYHGRLWKSVQNNQPILETKIHRHVNNLLQHSHCYVLCVLPRKARIDGLFNQCQQEPPPWP